MTEKENTMNRARFESLADAFGAAFERWPASERAAALAFAAENPAEAAAVLNAARALDAALDITRQDGGDLSLLTARVLSAARKAKPARQVDYRAVFALAACAVFGVLIGYGGGLLAPPSDADEFYFASAFEAPALEDEG